MEQGQQSFESQAESTGSTAVDALQRGAAEIGREAKRASSELLEKRVDLVFGFLDGVESAARAAARELETERHPRLAQYVNRAADEVATARTRFSGTDVNEMIASAENLARTRPVVVLGMAFAAGFAFVRLLKSSAPQVPTRGNGFHDDDDRAYGSSSGYGDRKSYRTGRSGEEKRYGSQYGQSTTGQYGSGESYGSRSGESGASPGPTPSGQFGRQSTTGESQGRSSRSSVDQEPKDEPSNGRNDE